MPISLGLVFGTTQIFVPIYFLNLGCYEQSLFLPLFHSFYPFF